MYHWLLQPESCWDEPALWCSGRKVQRGLPSCNREETPWDVQLCHIIHATLQTLSTSNLSINLWVPGNSGACKSIICIHPPWLALSHAKYTSHNIWVTASLPTGLVHRWQVQYEMKWIFMTSVGLLIYLTAKATFAFWGLVKFRSRRVSRILYIFKKWQWTLCCH